MGADERERLRSGPQGQLPEGFVVRIEFDAPDPTVVVERCKQVLGAVLSASPWPDDESAFAKLLPAWFLDECAPEPTPEQAKASLEAWRSMTREQQVSWSHTVKWTLYNWLGWFEPNGDLSRDWEWWDSGVGSLSQGWIDVVVTGDPWPRGALEWLLRASGASDIST